MSLSIFFFFNDTATTEIYTLSLHDALPISNLLIHSADLTLFQKHLRLELDALKQAVGVKTARDRSLEQRSEEHTSELQSHLNLVCRLLLEKKKNQNKKLT